MSTNILEKYIQKMKRLRVDKARGAAPNKPLLLLAIVELIHEILVNNNRP